MGSTSNSVAEMFTMQRYLQMTALKGLKVDHFDSWAATFGEPVTAMELSPDGAGYRLSSRFARYAARGITGIMPRVELCRMEFWIPLHLLGEPLPECGIIQSVDYKPLRKLSRRSPGR